MRPTLSDTLLRNPMLSMGCLLAGLFPLVGVAQVSTTSEQVTHEERQLNVDSFDYVWNTVRDQYWDSALGGVDWDAARKELRPHVEAASSNQEAREVLRTLLDKMNVSHFGIIPAESYEVLEADKPRGSHTAGLDVRIVDDRVLVTDVEDGSPADNVGVRTGWQILQIGDTDVLAQYQQISEDLADHPHRRTILVDAAQGQLSGRAGESIHVVFGDENDETVALTIPLAPPRGKKVQFGHIPEFHVWIEVRELTGCIGYIRFNAFMDPAFLMPQFNQAMADYMDADGIIIDVRGNGGGLGEMGAAMMGWLLRDGREQMGTVILRDTQLKMIVHPRGRRYRGRVVVLIDEMSVSAAEFFASGVNDLKLGHLIGTRTAGAVLGCVVERLPNGDGFQYARANYLSKTTGQSLEGIGVPPHQEVQHQRQALLQGRDLQLEAAIAWIDGRR